MAVAVEVEKGPFRCLKLVAAIIPIRLHLLSRPVLLFGKEFDFAVRGLRLKICVTLWNESKFGTAKRGSDHISASNLAKIRCHALGGIIMICQAVESIFWHMIPTKN
jgi:hypothetical protein